MILGDLDALKEYLKDMNVDGGHAYYRKGVQDAIDVFFPQFIDDQPTIDPETLPIVRQLREELAKVKEEMDEVADLCGKLIVLCEPPKEWRMKLFRRHRGHMIGDYMGSGYPFVDAFNRIFDEFEGTASNSAYQAVRKATDKEAEKRKPQKEE